MRGVYRTVQIIIVIVNIVVAAIALTSVWPFAMGQFQVHLPESEDVDWHYSEGIVSLFAPIVIDNGGFYAIDDVVIQISVSNSSNYAILNSTEEWGSIPAGSEFVETLDLQIDLLELIENGADWIIFDPEHFEVQDDYFDVEIILHCKYTFRLIKFTASYQFVVPWAGLIKDIGFEPPQLVNSSGTYSVRVRYYVSTDDLIAGQAGFSVIIYNDTDSNPIATSTDRITLGRNYSDLLSFEVEEEAAMDLLVRNQTLTAVIQISFQDFTVETMKTIDWVAPGTMVSE